MNRSACAPALVFLFAAAVTTVTFAQAKPAAPTAPAPAQRAKFATPLKGEAAIEVIVGDSKRVAKEIVTVYKIRNMATAPIALLKIDEYWYDKAGKLVSTDTQRYKQPFLPGDIIEITTHAPASPGAERKNATFSHANGTIKPKSVKRFDS